MVNLSPKKFEELSTLLSTVPDGIKDRLRDFAHDTDSEFAEILDYCLKDRSHEAFRDFFAPFQLISHNPDTNVTSKCYLPEALLISVWDWMIETVSPDLTHRVLMLKNNESDFEFTKVDDSQFDDLRTEFSKNISRQLEQAEISPKKARKLMVRFGKHYPDGLSELAAVLKSTSTIREFSNKLPDKVSEVNEELKFLLRDLYDSAIDQAPEISACALSIMLGRLQKPWQLLRIFDFARTIAANDIISQTEVGCIGNLLLEDAEYYLKCLASPIDGYESAMSKVNALDMFAAISVGMNREIRIRSDGVWGKRVFAQRNSASKYMRRIHFAAQHSIERALSEATRSDCDPYMDEDGRDLAVAFATFLGLTKNNAGRAAVGAAHLNLLNIICESCYLAGEIVIKQIRNKECEDKSILETRIRNVVAILKALGFERDAEIMLRRGVPEKSRN